MPVYQYKYKYMKSEKSAIIPTKNEASNRIQFSVKQNLRIYRMCVKLCYGFSVNGLRGKGIISLDFFIFRQFICLENFVFIPLAYKIWK